MNIIPVALAILVAFVLAVILPWALSRMLERDDEGKEDR